MGKAAEKSLQVDRSVSIVEAFTPGTAAALKRLASFCKGERLKSFSMLRNDPMKDVSSNLSPYLHFGQISAQRCALAAKACGRVGGAVKKSSESFIEELVVRKELADNFCFYNPYYDSLKGCSGWAQASLKKHEKDKREHIYSRKELETGKTHDELWNAAQLQMVSEGKMHGFLRMYWAKKILEWTESPAVALSTAQYFNDKYSLDGRDPNGFVGIGWSIMGIHDMGWKERPIFGKIRFMNYAGCKRKFKVNEFVLKYPPAAANARKKLGEEKKDIFSGKKRKTTKS